MNDQLDLFATVTSPVTSATLREEARFGKWDAKSGMPLMNYYSSRINGDRFAAYEAAYRAESAITR